MDQVSRRASRAAESILGNESLTSNLDDTAAQVLIDWGIDCAEMIAQRTVGLNDAEAEEVMAPRLRALRKLMRQINQTIPALAPSRGENDKLDAEETLDTIIEQASIIYSPAFKQPTPEQREAFLKQNITPGLPSRELKPSGMIKKLRTFIETPTEGLYLHHEVNADSEHPQEERDDQEKQENVTKQSGGAHRRYRPRDLWKLLFSNRR
jgi:hypothetical protein